MQAELVQLLAPLNDSRNHACLNEVKASGLVDYMSVLKKRTALSS